MVLLSIMRLMAENSFMSIGDASQNLAAFLSDGLLIYCCYVVFDSDYRVVILPVLCTLGALSTNEPLGLGMAIIPIGLNHSIFLGNKLNAAGIVLNTAANVMVTIINFIRVHTLYVS